MAFPVSCKSLLPNRDPLQASLVTDSAEIAVSLRGNAYIASIGFTFTNTTGRTISRAGCGGPGWPYVEKNVNGRWVAAYYPMVLLCRTSPDFYWKAGAQIRDQVPFMAFVPGHNTMPELRVDSIEGVYRLHWGFVEGKDAGATNARQIDVVSNQFRMILKPSPPGIR